MQSDTSIFSKVWPTLVAILVMLTVSVVYFAPQLQGKEVPSSDIISHRGMVQELRAYEAETGTRSLWTNSMFGGMPAYQIYAPERGNLLRYVERGIFLGIDRPISYFFTIMLGLFVLLRVLGVSTWLSLIGAITFGLSANHMTLFEAGHMTKLRAISFMAPTLAGLILLFRGRYLGGLAVFALSLGLNVHANHPQMTFYLASACACFVIFRFITDLGEGQLSRFGKALAFSLLGAVLALGASYSKLSTTIEYGKDTMRGAPILTSTQASSSGPASSSEVDGLDWEYAMQWSNGVSDVLASFVPGIAGGNGRVQVANDGPLGTALRQRGAQLPPKLELPLYHGALPFTAGPAYFGAIAVYLFILAMFWLSPGWRYFFGASVLLTLLLSMGKNAGWLNHILFDVIPYFNKFRAPSSATSTTAMLVAAGGFLGLARLYTVATPLEKEKLLKTFYVATGITTVLLLAVAAIGPSLSDLAGSSDARLEQAGYPLDALFAERAAYMRSSALRTLIYVLIAAGAIWARLQGKLSTTISIIIIGIASLADVWTVGRQYLSAEDFVPKRQSAAQLTPRPVDQQILADPDPNYRVFDVSVNTFNDSKVSYFHKTVGGYHAAKLQRIQDLIDRYIGQGSQPVLNMLNTKYIISGEPGNERVQQNPGALGNAWFVRQVRVVASNDAEIAALGDMPLDSEAAVHQEFAEELPATSYTATGNIELTSYAPDVLTYKSTSDAPQLAIFSEMWYGPNKGWKATIDGNDAILIRANYALRALPLPAGTHEIVMRFEPDTFYSGEIVSYIASGLILLLCFAALYFAWKQSAKGRTTVIPPHAGVPITS